MPLAAALTDLVECSSRLKLVQVQHHLIGRLMSSPIPQTNLKDVASQ